MQSFQFLNTGINVENFNVYESYFNQTRSYSKKKFDPNFRSQSKNYKLTYINKIDDIKLSNAIRQIQKMYEELNKKLEN